MELLILTALVLIGLIFVYEFLESKPKPSSSSKILTADEASSTEDDKIRARSILKNLKPAEENTKAEKKSSETKEEILPDPFSNQEQEEK